MSTTVKDLIKEINNNRTNASSNVKDEQRVMQAMLNDKDYKVDVYKSTGVVGTYCPYEESRRMLTNVIKDTTKIGAKEAAELAENYEFGRAESEIMVGISKEFVNTYVETGRKLPLGGREKSNIALEKKVKEARANTYPKKVGVDANGKDIYENVNDGTVIPAHGTLKVHAGCPAWLKEN